MMKEQHQMDEECMVAPSKSSSAPSVTVPVTLPFFALEELS